MNLWQSMPRLALRGVRNRICWLALGASLIAPAAVGAKEVKTEAPAIKQAQVVAGYLEKAWLGDRSVVFEAKLDTGANSSSIHVPDFKPVKRDGQEWITIDMTNKAGESFVQEVPVKRYVTIRRAGTAKVERPIVVLRMCVAGKTAESEFTLADRTGQSFQVLVGRKFLKGRILVDSGESYTGKDSCAGTEAKS